MNDLPAAAPPIIYLDADACPAKDLIYKVAARFGLPLKVVANNPFRIDPLPGLDVESISVPGTPDAADDWIAERAVKGDLVLTADIPLAARVLANGVRCLDFRGGEFNPSRIGDALAIREFNATLRQMGVTTGGPSPYSAKDRSKLASALDAAVNRMMREAGRV